MQVLATLILLSFTKIFHAIALIIKSVKLSCVNGYEDLFVWYMDGHIPYFSLEHNILMAAAVLFLLLAVPYTLSLLFDAVIEKYLTRIRFFRRQWIKFKPFVDAYHGPYKDNCRFWTGLLLLVRMSFTFFSLYLGKYMNASLIFITTSTGVLLSLMIYFDGVYQKKYLNILEWLFLINGDPTVSYLQLFAESRTTAISKWSVLLINLESLSYFAKKLDVTSMECLNLKTILNQRACKQL